MNVVTYHRIATDDDPYCVPPKVFARQVAAAAFCCRVAALCDAAGASLPQLVLTFDDGFADNYDAALPVLLQRGLAATVFIVTGAVGGMSDWHARRVQTLTWSQIREMAAAGIEVGSHTVTHLDMARADEATIRDELVRSKATLEDELGTEVVSFSYPYHSYDQRSARLVREAGYRYAVVGLRAWYPPDGEELDPLQIPRVPVTGRDGTLRFLAKAHTPAADLEFVLRLLTRPADHGTGRAGASGPERCG